MWEPLKLILLSYTIDLHTLLFRILSLSSVERQSLSSVERLTLTVICSLRIICLELVDCVQ